MKLKLVNKLTLAAALLSHDLGGGDGSVDGELLAELLVVDGVVQVLDVKIDSLVPEMANEFRAKAKTAGRIDVALLKELP